MLSVLSHWPAILCHYHAVLLTVALWDGLKSGALAALGTSVGPGPESEAQGAVLVLDTMGAGPVFMSEPKAGPQFPILLPSRGSLSRFSAWSWKRGDVGNVKFSFLLSSVHLFLFLGDIHVLQSLT